MGEHIQDSPLLLLWGPPGAGRVLEAPTLVLGLMDFELVALLTDCLHYYYYYHYYYFP